MFVVCVIAVAVFVRQQVSASDSLTTTVNAPVNGVCSGISGTKATTKPTADLCSKGSPSGIIENNVGWVWKCFGINGGASAYCSVSKYVPVVAPASEPGTTPTSTIGTSTTDISATSTINPATGAVYPANTATTTSGVIAETPVATDSVATLAPSTVVETTETVSAVGDSEENNEQQRQQTTEAMISAEVEHNENPIQLDRQQNYMDNSLQETAVVERSQIIKASVVVAAKNLAQNSNPKLSGIISDSLKVEKVALVEKNNGAKQLELSGKSQPNAIVVLYIFSNDPIVISLKADANGIWNYELDKELADGQHEVYVTVADEAGEIISKSEPIAFVKTAQAANMIPLSELNDNKSPVDNSAKQFVLMAIIVMSICLAIALAAIGFLTHNKNFNEGIN